MEVILALSDSNGGEIDLTKKLQFEVFRLRTECSTVLQLTEKVEVAPWVGFGPTASRLAAESFVSHTRCVKENLAEKEGLEPSNEVWPPLQFSECSSDY